VTTAANTTEISTFLTASNSPILAAVQLYGLGNVFMLVLHAVVRIAYQHETSNWVINVTHARMRPKVAVTKWLMNDQRSAVSEKGVEEGTRGLPTCVRLDIRYSL
jgi:hypothetical protein